MKRQDTIFALEHKGKTKITVTHVTIRQSIVFLMLRLLVLDILATLAALLFLSPFLFPIPIEIKIQVVSHNIVFFLMLATIKIGFTIFVILRWLNDHYEITPEFIVHKRGILWRKIERFKLVHVKSFGLEQGVFGKVFDYGTLRFYDWFLRKDYSVYLIHNPKKYLGILEDLLPYADEEKDILREHILEPEEELREEMEEEIEEED